ncbi:unnamed protein product [Sphenostylis stenocarpa]|uniref:Uncharacterized protein n=1 Tax=Sphenostylis stenocarpa TaxID=92480 RepID=A0AA86W0A0_9FABA|nr:unnamed protein product [Sphenostylis stenocarpa]
MGEYQCAMHEECVVLNPGDTLGEPFLFVFESLCNHCSSDWARSLVHSYRLKPTTTLRVKVGASLVILVVQLSSSFERPPKKSKIFMVDLYCSQEAQVKKVIKGIVVACECQSRWLGRRGDDDDGGFGAGEERVRDFGGKRLVVWFTIRDGLMMVVLVAGSDEGKTEVVVWGFHR